MPTTSTLHSTTHQTPVGELRLIASDRGLRAILWPKVSPLRAGISPRPRRDLDHSILRKTASRSLPTDKRPLPVIVIVAGVMW